MNEMIRFQRALEEGTHITLTAVGDIMMQGPTQICAQGAMDVSLTDPDERAVSGFARLLSAARHDLNLGDLLIGNLETPLAADLAPRRHRAADGRMLCDEVRVEAGVLHDGVAYGETAYPRLVGRLGLPNFNAHPGLARALKRVGFDVVSTANNHALDRGHNGIDRTIDALEMADLDYVGTLRSDEALKRQEDSTHLRYPYIVKQRQGIGLAFFSFTQFINTSYVGFPDRMGQVCQFPDRRQTVQMASLTGAISEAKARPDVDLVVVAAHWGRDYVGWVLPSQRRLARQLVDAGADLILGHHPHVLQPMKNHQTRDGREALVLYSLGNFMSDMYGVSARATAIFYIGITKNDSGAFIRSVSYLPMARCISTEPESGRSIIHPLAINRVHNGQLVREHAHIVRVLGAGNLKRADDLGDFAR